VKVSSKIFILIVLVAIAIYGCKKHPGPSPMSYVAKMAGAHNWHGTESYQCASCLTGIVDTSYSITDSFTINVISDSQIAVTFSPYSSCDTFYFASLNTSVHAITFTTSATNPYYTGSVVYNPYYNATIVYYYIANTMEYQSTTSNPGESWTILLSTP